MNLTELSKNVAEAANMSATDSKEAIQAVFDQIAVACAKGEDVAIPGFGKFAVKDTAAREGRNPQTGEPMHIKASKRISFSAAKGLKERL